MGQGSNSEDSSNLFKNWKVAKNDVLFKTRSPFPEKSYFYSQEALPACSNSSIQIENPNDDDIKKYLKEQIAILKFNNPTFSLHQIETALSNRLIHWPGNTKIKERFNEFNILEMIEDVFALEDYKQLIKFDYSHHWYSDEIERMSSHLPGEKWGDKTRAKQLARKSNNSDAIREDIKEVSLWYKDDFGVFPTVEYLTRATDYNKYAIRRYANGFYSKQSEHSRKLVEHYLNLYPGLTHEELAEKTDMNLRTIRRYSKLP